LCFAIAVPTIPDSSEIMSAVAQLFDLRWLGRPSAAAVSLGFSPCFAADCANNTPFTNSYLRIRGAASAWSCISLGDQPHRCCALRCRRCRNTVYATFLPASGCTVDRIWSTRGGTVVASHNVTLSDSECREITAALELMIEHCNVMLANGPVHSFSARRQSAKAIL
jgi:hypothetical protein